MELKKKMKPSFKYFSSLTLFLGSICTPLTGNAANPTPPQGPQKKPAAPAPMPPAKKPLPPLPPPPSPRPETCSRPTEIDTEEILSVVENQLHAIQHSDFASAYNIFTASLFQQTTSLDNFVFFIKSYPVFTMNKSAMFGGLEFKNNIATLQGTLTSSDGQTQRVEYFFIKEANLWKIAGIQILKAAPQGPSIGH